MKFLLLVVLFAAAVVWEDLYDRNSPVNLLNRMNFAKRVTNNRKKGITIVHFYSAGDSHSAAIKDDYEAFTKDNMGMYNLGAINCDDNYDICEKEGLTEFPVFRIYPEYPMQHQDLKDDNFNMKRLKKRASKFIQDKVIEITGVNHDTFIKDNPGKPKVLLFTDKAGTPTIYKALSYNFEKTLFFGIVRSDESSLAKKYKVKNFPAIFLVQPGKKPLKFDDDINYYNIANFINIHSEIFDFGDAPESETKSAASKPWMSEKLPQLTKDSSEDICFGKKGLWVILINNEQPSDGLISTISSVRESFVSNIEGRGLEFAFSWVDTNLQPEWATTFDIQEYPQVVVLNHGKRKKFLLASTGDNGLITESELSNTLNKIISGDARFKRVADNTLPELNNAE